MTDRERNSTEAKLGWGEEETQETLQEINPSALGLGLMLSLDSGPSLLPVLSGDVSLTTQLGATH